jgi:TfoX/Sxy family transcriptional regulator of competence genes
MGTVKSGPGKDISILEGCVEEHLAGSPFEKRKWFGCPVYLVAGKMFAGVYRNSVFLRLPQEKHRELLSTSDDVHPFEPLPGRIMREYVAIPDILCSKKAFMGIWLMRSYAYTLSLPPAKIKLGRHTRK